MRLVFIHGPPAVGKLTIARELAALTGLPLFHNHLVVDALTPVFPFGTGSFIALREEIWLSVFREAARQGISLIFTFAPERTVRPIFIRETVQAVETTGGKVVFVQLTCPHEVLEERIADPSRVAHGKLRSGTEFRAMAGAGAFEYPSLPAAELTIDTSELAPRQAAARIRDLIN